MPARLHLAFSAPGGISRLHCLQQDPPWKVVRGFPNSAGESLVHLNNVSGGIFGGDHLSMHIEVGSHAAAQITTTGSTRLYRPRKEAADARLVSEIHLGPGALLEYLPDSLIPFSHARCEQRTDAFLAAGATLLWWETIAPGRVASGELFDYTSLRIHNRIFSQGQAIYLDRMHLAPRATNLSSIARLGKFRYLTSFMICRSGEDAQTWRVLEEKLREIAEQRSHAGTLWGATAMMADGVLVRGLAESGLHITEDLHRFWAFAKNYLCGRAASPPRRTY